MPDPYKTLKVPRTATPEQITKAYRALVMKYHPDRNPGDKRAERRFKLVQEAYDLLSDPARRSRFDATGETGPSKPDAEMTEIIRIVHCIFMNVLGSLIANGRDPSLEDLMPLMREVVTEGHTQLSRQRSQHQKDKKAWARVVGRFVVDEGFNHLEAMAQARVAEIESKLISVEKEIKQNEAVMAFLKKYSFRADTVFGYGGMTTFGFRTSTSY